MSFLGFIVKNPFRNRTRTLLAVIGIAIGIATIVALGIVTDGLKYSTEDALKSDESDFMILEPNVSDMMFSSIEEQRVEDIKNTPGVQDAGGSLIGTYAVGNNPYFSVMGINENKLYLSGISNINGQCFSEGNDEIILGKMASENLNKTIGDTLEISGKKFKITGIFETGDIRHDGSAIMSLDKLQEL